MLHPLLIRQLQRCEVDVASAPDAASWGKLLERISKAYKQADEERYLLERSLAISSDELLDLNATLSASRAELSAERDRLQAVFSSLGDGLFVLDPMGACLMANPAAERLLGWPASELMDSKVLRTIAGLDIQPAGLRGPICEEDAGFSRVDGTTLPVSYVLNPILSAGQLKGSVLVFHDITERQRSQQALRREHQQLLEIIANAPIGMAMFDASMCYLAYSQRWLDDYELVGQNLIGRNHYEVLPDIPTRWKDAHQVALSGSVISCPEDVFERGDGSKVHLRWAIHPWHTPEGTLGGIVMVADRINDLVEAREAALEAARIKAEFLANMSHEI
ncbi:MAG: PAS domain S-box protein, partial [Planctomycetota bacterium]